MTHHLSVLETEIQMYVADNVMYSHGGAETQVARYISPMQQATGMPSLSEATRWLSLWFN